jgi:hypothetical protein
MTDDELAAKARRSIEEAEKLIEKLKGIIGEAAALMAEAKRQDTARSDRSGPKRPPGALPAEPS